MRLINPLSYAFIFDPLSHAFIIYPLCHAFNVDLLSHAFIVLPNQAFIAPHHLTHLHSSILQFLFHIVCAIQVIFIHHAIQPSYSLFPWYISSSVSMHILLYAYSPPPYSAHVMHSQHHDVHGLSEPLIMDQALHPSPICSCDFPAPCRYVRTKEQEQASLRIAEAAVLSLQISAQASRQVPDDCLQHVIAEGCREIWRHRQCQGNLSV